MVALATERLYQFPSKATATPTDLIYGGDASNAFDEVNFTVAGLFGAYPNVLSLGNLVIAANTFPYWNNSETLLAGSISALAIALLADTTTTQMQTTLGLVIGTNVQAHSAALDSIAGLTTIADEMIYTTGANTYATNPVSAASLAMMAQTSNALILSTIGALPLAGGTLTGAIINYTSTPTNPLELVPKAYVDTIAQGITVQGACFAGTTASLVAAGWTYNNGSAGVGATLTAPSNGVFTTDGTTPAISSRILVLKEVGGNAPDNGIYSLTTSASGSQAVLTRTTDYDLPAQINAGDLVVVDNGSTLKGSSWLQTATVTTIGTSPITFSQFSAALPVGLAFGGTGAALSASNGGIVYSTATTLAILAGVSTAGLAFVSGANGAPSWLTGKPITKINPVLIINSGTYTPSTGIQVAWVRAVAGGGGGGTAQVAGSAALAGGGGGAGSYGEGIYNAATLGSSVACTIGAMGAANSVGGNTSFGTLLTTVGGQPGASTANVTANFGGAGGIGGTGGYINIAGNAGEAGFGAAAATSALGQIVVIGGKGGDSHFGAGGFSPILLGNGSAAGNSAINYGSGGAGAAYSGNSGSAAGATGAPGAIMILEFISI